MNNLTQGSDHTVKIRLTLDVHYILGAENLEEIETVLYRECVRAIGDGMLTGATSAEVDTYEIDISTPPLPSSHGESDNMELDAPSPAKAQNLDSASILMAVACRNASGEPDLPLFAVTATQEECHLGIHYDRAQVLATQAGYEGPFICFDPLETRRILAAACGLDLVPQVVVVDFTEGLVHSVRCDAGQIKVICYDTSETEESLDAVANLPVGQNGQSVLCWAAIEAAECDPGLKKNRD